MVAPAGAIFDCVTVRSWLVTAPQIIMFNVSFELSTIFGKNTEGWPNGSLFFCRFKRYASQSFALFRVLNIDK